MTMVIRRSKTSDKGTFIDIPKKYTESMKERKKYVLYHNEKKYNITAYTIRDIADHFGIPYEKISERIYSVTSFDGTTDINLCTDNNN